MSVINEVSRASRGRLHNLDALRGICAMLVVIFHSLPSFSYVGSNLWPGRPTFYIDLGRIGVGAFFLISGYVIPFSAKPGQFAVSRFWVVRFFRLWPAYWLAILLGLLTGADSAHLLTHKQILINFTMLQQFVKVPDLLGVFWTLQIELIFYIAVTGLLIIGKLQNQKTIALCFVAMCVVAFASAIVRWHTGHKLPTALPIALSLMFMATHMRMRRIEGLAPRRWMLGAFFVMLIPTCLLGYNGNVAPNDDSMRWIVAYSLAVLLFLVFEKAQSAPRFFVLLGTISYSIYLLGPVALALSRHLLHGHPFVVLITTMLLSVALASAAFLLVEQPSHKFGKRLSTQLFGVKPIVAVPDIQPSEQDLEVGRR